MSRVGLPLLILAAVLPLFGCGTTEEFYFYGDPPKKPPSPGYGPPDRSPQITMIFVAPLETTVGAPVTLAGSAVDPDRDPLRYEWSADFGTITGADKSDATLTCKAPGEGVVTLKVSDGHLYATHSVSITCAEP